MGEGKNMISAAARLNIKFLKGSDLYAAQKKEKGTFFECSWNLREQDNPMVTGRKTRCTWELGFCIHVH